MVKLLRIPAPVWLFKWMQNDLYKMFIWMKNRREPNDIIEQTKVILPELKDLRSWMEWREKQNTSIPKKR